MGRILIADDQAEVRDVLRDVLEAEGHEIIDAEDGDQALARAVARDPDLMILDHMMPGITGIDVLRRLRAQDWRTPVMILTAFGDDSVTWQGWSAGASMFLDKPFDRRVLLAWVARLLSAPEVTQDEAGYDLQSHRAAEEQESAWTQFEELEDRGA